ncbi:MAG TPA: response regulator transcription factor [Solirubrobacteraceae bacterium]|jgi:two-component system OmpR family response regulator|nr:response regulator transcription factor [Solirubrobacteraceae bacterium]
MPGALILLVEDDPELRALVGRGLEEEGFAVSGAGTGAEAMERISAQAPAAVIIDVGLPDADGRDLCQALRAQGIQSPVLFLTARDALTDRLAGFGAGGDDYLTKPFSLAELTARLRAVLNRAGVDGKVSAAGLSLDPTNHEVSCGERSVRLTPTEFRLLGALAAQPERAIGRRDLMRAAWPDGAVVHDNTIDVYLARLRRKLRTLPGAPAITTVHGVGYRLQ